MIPFSRDVFLDLVAQMNAWLWPGQLVALLLAIAIIVLSLRPQFHIERLPAFSLAVAWGFVGIVYYGMHFTLLNWAAWIAAALFVLQSLQI